MTVAPAPSSSNLGSDARAALSAAAGRTAALIASLPDAALRLPRSEWNAGQAAAHLAIALRAYADSSHGEEGKWAGLVPDQQRLAQQIAAVNAATLAAEPERSPAAAAALVTEAAANFLAATAGWAPDAVIATPWYGGGVTLTVLEATCLLLGEQLIHGYDIAMAAHQPWPIPKPEACLVFQAIRAMFPRMLNPDVAPASVTYELRIGRVSRLIVSVVDGRVAVADAPSGRAVDCHIAGDPVALLLVGYGRKSQWWAIARGRLIAWGRKPWLGFRFVAMFPGP
jgi:uncharacterized protein (TIGR03083 family)